MSNYRTTVSGIISYFFTCQAHFPVTAMIRHTPSLVAVTGFLGIVIFTHLPGLWLITVTVTITILIMILCCGV